MSPFSNAVLILNLIFSVPFCKASNRHEKNSFKFFFPFKNNIFCSKPMNNSVHLAQGKTVFGPAEGFNEDQDFPPSDTFIHADQVSADLRMELPYLTNVQFLVIGVGM